MRILKAKKSDYKFLFEKYISYFNDGIKESRFLFKNYDAIRNCYLIKINNKIISAIFFKYYELVNNKNKKTEKIMFFYGAFTSVDYRKKGMMKYLISNIINDNPGNLFFLQPADPRYYKSSNFFPYIEHKVCSNIIDFDLNYECKTLKPNANQLLSIYKNYFFANQMPHIFRDLKYYELLLDYIKIQDNINICMIKNSYIIYDSQTLYVLEIISNNEDELKFLLNNKRNFWFFLINQKEIEKYFNTRIFRPVIYSCNSKKPNNNIFFNDILLIE